MIVPTKEEVCSKTYPLSMPILNWSPLDILRLEDLLRGCFISGSTGSGKSSAPLSYLTKACMKAGFGMLMLCPMPSDVDTYQKWAKQEGRNDIVVFSLKNKSLFDFLSYALRQGIIEELIELLGAVYQVSSGQGGISDDGNYFQSSAEMLMRHSFEAVHSAKGSANLFIARDCIRGLPNSVVEMKMERPLVMKLIDEAKENSPNRLEDIEEAENYISKELVHLASKTRSCIVQNVSILLDLFTHYPLRNLLIKKSDSENKNECSPDDVLAGKIVLVECPIGWGVAARVLGIIWKYLTQKAIQNRIDPKIGVIDSTLPIVITADEFQYFICSNDPIFQTTARGYKAISIYSTQNLHTLYSQLGQNTASTEATKALLGNLQLKIAAANEDKETCTWMSDLIGREWKITISKSLDALTRVVRQITESKTLVYKVPPEFFSSLKTGSKRNQYQVETIVFQGGKKFFWNKKNYLQVRFHQRKHPTFLESLLSSVPFVRITAKHPEKRKDLSSVFLKSYDFCCSKWQQWTSNDESQPQDDNFQSSEPQGDDL